MAVYDHGKALPGTERKPSSPEKIARVRFTRQQWAAKNRLMKAQGTTSRIYKGGA